jgi:hypothetical protein
MTGHLDKEQLNSMTKEQLVELAAEMQLSTEGRKADLVKRIAAAEVEVQDEAELTEEDKAAIAEAEAEDAAKAADEAAADHEELSEAAAEAAEEVEAKQTAKPALEAGGNVLVTCCWDYYDNALNSVVHVGDQLKVSEERAELLKSLKLAK